MLPLYQSIHESHPLRFARQAAQFSLCDAESVDKSRATRTTPSRNYLNSDALTISYLTRKSQSLIPGNSTEFFQRIPSKALSSFCRFCCRKICFSVSWASVAVRYRVLNVRFSFCIFHIDLFLSNIYCILFIIY